MINPETGSGHPVDGGETIFFPFRPDTIEAHSWVTLEGLRFCLGFLATCPYCIYRI